MFVFMFIFLLPLLLAMPFQKLINLPFKSFLFFLKYFINHSTTVLYHGVVANWHAKKGSTCSHSYPLSKPRERMTANLLVEILLSPSNKILFSACVMFYVTVSKLSLSKPT